MIYGLTAGGARQRVEQYRGARVGAAGAADRPRSPRVTEAEPGLPLFDIVPLDERLNRVA